MFTKFHRIILAGRRWLWRTFSLFGYHSQIRFMSNQVPRKLGLITWSPGAIHSTKNFGKVSKKLVHLLKWTTFCGRTGLNFVWMVAPVSVSFSKALHFSRPPDRSRQRQRDEKWEPLCDSNVFKLKFTTLPCQATGYLGSWFSIRAEDQEAWKPPINAALE